MVEPFVHIQRRCTLKTKVNCNNVKNELKNIYNNGKV